MTGTTMISRSQLQNSEVQGWPTQSSDHPT